MIENVAQALYLAVAATVIVATIWWTLKALWRLYRWATFPHQHSSMTLSNTESINWYATMVHRRERSKKFRGPKLLDLL